MNIFFALALVMCFACSAVLGIECGTEKTGDCLTEWQNAVVNGELDSFYERCATETGSNPLRTSCAYCCPECASGFTYTSSNLGGNTKSFSYPDPASFENCAKACTSLTGCTGYEYNIGGDEGYKCGTYTGGDSSIMSDSQLDTWTSCILDSA